MTHGDLIPGNVLVAEGRLAGILDAGGFGAADPALDLVAAWHLLDDGPREVLRAALGSDELDWERIERLMGDHWQVLLWQLLHFLYVFPSERHLLPTSLMGRLIGRLADEITTDDYEPMICRGPMLDPKLYRREIEATGADPRPRRELVLLAEEG